MTLTSRIAKYSNRKEPIGAARPSAGRSFATTFSEAASEPGAQCVAKSPRRNPIVLSQRLPPPRRVVVGTGPWGEDRGATNADCSVQPAFLWCVVVGTGP